MDMSDATEGAPFWQLHIAAWQQSGLTQKAYCEHQELRYSTFGYWVRKLRRAAEPATEKKGAGFVPVIPATVQPTGLSLPNGLEIRGIEANNLSLVRDLLGMLA